jgi:hypothetical protein
MKLRLRRLNVLFVASWWRVCETVPMIVIVPVPVPVTVTVTVGLSIDVHQPLRPILRDCTDKARDCDEGGVVLQFIFSNSDHGLSWCA